MTLTTSTSNSILDHTFRNVPFETPGDVWLALTDSAGNEVAFAGYARVRLDDKLGEAAAGFTTNTATVEFPVAGETWSVHGVAVYGSESSNDRLQSARLRRSLSVVQNASLRFLPNTLKIFIGAVPDGIWSNGLNTGLPGSDKPSVLSADWYPILNGNDLQLVEVGIDVDLLVQINDGDWYPILNGNDLQLVEVGMDNDLLTALDDQFDQYTSPSP
jgi:hypothetical protein